MKWSDAGTKKMSVSTFGSLIKLMKLQCTASWVSPRDRCGTWGAGVPRAVPLYTCNLRAESERRARGQALSTPLVRLSGGWRWGGCSSSRNRPCPGAREEGGGGPGGARGPQGLREPPIEWEARRSRARSESDPESRQGPDGPRSRACLPWSRPASGWIMILARTVRFHPSRMGPHPKARRMWRRLNPSPQLLESASVSLSASFLGRGPGLFSLIGSLPFFGLLSPPPLTAGTTPPLPPPRASSPAHFQPPSPFAAHTKFRPPRLPPAPRASPARGRLWTALVSRAVRPAWAARRPILARPSVQAPRALVSQDDSESQHRSGTLLPPRRCLEFPLVRVGSRRQAVASVRPTSAWAAAGGPRGNRGRQDRKDPPLPACGFPSPFGAAFVLSTRAAACRLGRPPRSVRP